MRAPRFIPTFIPVEAYKARFNAPDGPNLAATIGRALIAGGADLGRFGSLRSAIQALGDDTAGRARALQDGAALAHLVDVHGSLQGGAAVAAQPQALDELDRIKAEGQATLGSPGMIAAYDQQIGPAIDDAAGRITDHALKQMTVERQAVADQTIQAAQQAAAADWQDPARFVQGLGTVQALAAGQAGPDASDEDRAGAARTAVGGAVAKAVGRALAAGEPEFAAHIVGGWGDTLSPAAYQLAMARLGRAAQNGHMASVFATAAGGNRSAEAVDALPATALPDTVAIAAPVGAAVHPIAGGVVTAQGGAPDNASVQVVHPDGSSTTYGGLGLAAVAPGQLVVPAHVIGSAGPMVTLAATAPTGDTIDADTLLRNAGGAGALIGGMNTPRVWDQQTILDRIAGRQDLAPDDRAFAASLAQRRMNQDTAQQASSDLAAGRSVVSLAAAAPGSLGQAADLPPDLAAQLTPDTLAQVDGALRGAAQAPTVAKTDSPDSLRLELMQRQDPGQFVQTNLAPFIGSIHPAELAQLATNQAGMAAGQAPDRGQDFRSAVLDGLARHEFIGGTNLPDQALPAIKGQAETLLRLNQTDMTDRPAIDGMVSDAIQSLVPPA
jgi:murein DD-endopeptidase MepM/ murein hydrolase activator NlpD